jgi:hypothetical protein
MRRRIVQKRAIGILLVPASIALLACGASSKGNLAPPTGQKSSPVRTACQAGKAVFLDQSKLVCSPFPERPDTGDAFWAGARPCNRTIMQEGAMADTETYDYAQLWSAAGALYDANDNLNSISLADIAADSTAKAVFTYDATHTISGAHIEGAGIMPIDYVYQYQGGRRVSEGIMNGAAYEARWYYVYDSSGRLIAEGPPVGPGTPPSRYDMSTLSVGADGFAGDVVPAPMIDPNSPDLIGASGPFNAYFYDGDGRLVLQGYGDAPGLHRQRLDYTYASGNLTTIVAGKTDATDPTLGAQTWTYTYGCASK